MLHITPWERLALELLATGATTTEMAGRFSVSEMEIEARLRGLFLRMGAAGRTDAIAAAWHRGLLPAAAVSAAAPGARTEPR